MIIKPEEPIRLTAGRYAEPLWEYGGRAYSAMEASCRYEKDRADYLAARLEKFSANYIASSVTWLEIDRQAGIREAALRAILVRVHKALKDTSPGLWKSLKAEVERVLL